MFYRFYQLVRDPSLLYGHRQAFLIGPFRGNREGLVAQRSDLLILEDGALYWLEERYVWKAFRSNIFVKTAAASILIRGNVWSVHCSHHTSAGAGPASCRMLFDIRTWSLCVCPRKMTCVSGLSGDVSLLVSRFLRRGWMEPRWLLSPVRRSL